MILHTASKRIFPQRDLLDDAIVGGPRFDVAAIRQPFDCLVMRAVHFRKTMRSAAGMAQWLNFPIALLRQIVPFDVELQRPPEGDVEYLNASANCENRRPA